MTLRFVRIYTTPWRWFPVGFVHLMFPFPFVVKAIIVCAMLRFIPGIYHAKRGEKVLISSLYDVFWRRLGSLRSTVANVCRIFSSKLAWMALISLILRIAIFELGIAASRRVPRFNHSVLYRSPGFRKGLDCLSGTTRTEERKFLLAEATRCGRFVVAGDGSAMHSYGQFVKTLEGNDSACLAATNKKMKMFGKVSMDNGTYAGPPHAYVHDLDELKKHCKMVNYTCGNIVKSAKTHLNMTWLLLKSPPRRILIRLRNDVAPNFTVLREVIIAEAQGLSSRNITRIALGVSLSFQFSPCYRHGRVVDGARKVPHLSFSPWLLGLLLIIEVVLWESPAMIGTGCDRPDADEEAEMLGSSALSDLDL